MIKLELNFMVVPEELTRLAEVPDKVTVKITDPNFIGFDNVLGQSGRALAKQGARFYFRRKIAEQLVKIGVAEFCA